MDLFKELPLDLQEKIFDIYETERKLDIIQRIQTEIYKDVMSEFNRYQTVFYKEEHDDWCSDLLFFTLKYEMRMNEVYPSFII